MLRDRQIVLGITGSIAAYKAADLASKLTQGGARVDVLMTEAATRFITPLTLRSLTGRPVFLDMFDPGTELAEEHVELARRADAVMLAPASATTIAKLAQGLADDMVSLTVLATEAPVLVAPAMDHQMYENAASQANLATLRERGYVIVGPAEGRLASGRMGLGRLEETEVLLGALRHVLGRQGDLAGRRVVVSAGGTREALDPVRFITNASSGKMGYALAEAARDRGADVTLVSTVSALPCPYGVCLVPVETVAEMREAVLSSCRGADALIMAAAVSDYRPVERALHKVKKGPERVSLELEKTPDFLLEVKGSIVKVGFAAETDDLLANARTKLKAKGLDLIAANDVTAPGSGFGVDTNEVTLIDPSGGEEALPLMSKYDVAQRILDRVVALLRERT
ncbi:MAG: bifunctional phosphopantothenoylcysteine decarboxylase/phosphopantothenate--cysteine ligase CoaBC [Chloroflexi bacterium]|nr:bifunctional phosphopantothenoylcysteine decarboxylase/phosphopantothenate--cysteine ligase CoaBC [Chloroflexota bacterium]